LYDSFFSPLQVPAATTETMEGAAIIAKPPHVAARRVGHLVTTVKLVSLRLEKRLSSVQQLAWRL